MNIKRFHYTEIFLLALYKFILDFYFLPNYFSTYGYLIFFTDTKYEFSSVKWIISVVVLGIFFILTYRIYPNENGITFYFIRIIYLFAVIPTLSIYAFMDNIDTIYVIYPVIFYTILILLMKYSSSRIKEKNEIFKIPKILNCDVILLISCGIIAVAIWLYMGTPIITTFDDTLEQRLTLRAEAMPKLMGYMHAFLGGVVFPYLFAKFSDDKKYFFAAISLLLGYLTFCINGMKTWVFVYALYFFVVIVKKIDKTKIEYSCLYTEGIFIGIVLVCCLIYTFSNSSIFLGQLGRVLIVPPAIGYKSVDFFQNNELLYLRESIFRFFAESPYVNGSDFYIFYGADSTISSARSNCGLWGDAYKNFGIIGLVIYPFLYNKIFNIVLFNGRRLTETLNNYIALIIFWNAINMSFFTWLLSGGVIVLILLEKIESGNLNYYREIKQINSNLNDNKILIENEERD